MEENKIIVAPVKLTGKQKAKKVILVSILMTIVSLGLFGFCLFWQMKTDALAIINAFYFSGIVLFAFGWYVLMINMNIFSPFTYGLKTFFLIFIGKRPKKDYFEYMQSIKENPIHKKYYLIPFIAAGPNLIVAIILNLTLL